MTGLMAKTRTAQLCELCGGLTARVWVKDNATP